MQVQTILRPTVGQLAKTRFPTLKTLPEKDLTVGRQQNENLRTHTHAGEDYISGEFDFNYQIPDKNRHFRLHKRAEGDFIQAVPQVFRELENTEVVFHNPDYVEEIFESYYPVHAHLFLDWVKTFAIIRKADRTQPLKGVIESSEDDFLAALRLFKLQSRKPKRKHIISQKEKVWRAIIHYFPDKPFSSRDIADKSLIERPNVNGVLLQLKAEKKLKRCPKQHGLKHFQLIQNNRLNENAY